MNYVSNIKSNLKGAVDIALGARTIIIGENASGKSAIIQSVSLALSAAIEDDAGRVITQELNLFSLQPQRSGELYAIATLANGGECRYETTGTLASAKRAKHQLPASVSKEKVFPLRQIRAVLTGSSDSLQEFFLGALSSTLTEEDVLSTIPPSLHSDFTSVAGIGNHGQRLLRALAAADKKKREASARRKEAENVITVKSAGLPPPVGEGALAALESALEAALHSVEGGAFVDSSENKAPKIAVDTIGLLKQHVAAETDECTVCGKLVAPHMLRLRLQQLEAQFADVKVPLSDSASDARQHHAECQSNYQAALRANEAWSTINTARNAIVAAEQSAAKWKIFESACSTAVETLLKSAVSRLETRVQAFLPKSDTFGILLSFGERSMCAFGLKRGEFLDTSLSGAEWARVTAALGCALSEGELRVIVPEDRSMSAATLTSVLDAFSESPAQIIIATTTEPTRIPQSWTVVRL